MDIGMCNMTSCGICFVESGQWMAGIPFVAEEEQTSWVTEFFDCFSAYNKGDGVGCMDVVASQSATIPNRAVTTLSPEEYWFGCQDPFPTQRRIERRVWDSSFMVDAVHEQWLSEAGIRIGQHLTAHERAQAIQLLWTWKDVFVDQVHDLPATDLVVHMIPTVPHAKPYRARDPIYAKDEVRWQMTELPKMIGTIVDRGASPWVAKTTWVSKKETVVDKDGRWPLRMVHTYCQLNDATLKANYPMKRIEPILDNLADPAHRFFFTADAAYGFYAVPIYPPHAYKTAFNTLLGQFYYQRMPMGLTGAPATYARLKDITFGPIPSPQAEPAVLAAMDPSIALRYFFDDDFGAAYTFSQLLNFLHCTYFPRVHWARLTLKPAKSQFFVASIDPLGMTVGMHKRGEEVTYGLKANDAKRGKIEAYPVPQNEKDLEAFIYLTTYLKTLIPRRTELVRIMKQAVIREGEQKKRGPAIGFQWGECQQVAFDQVKQAIREMAAV